jgi:hypothetical protein
MHILILEALGLLAWLLVGFLVAVAFGSARRSPVIAGAALGCLWVAVTPPSADLPDFAPAT